MVTPAAADAANTGSVSVYDVRYEERSGGVYVNSPLVVLYDKEGVPAVAVVILGCFGTTGLFKITEIPLVASQSEFTCAAGMVGLFDSVL